MHKLNIFFLCSFLLHKTNTTYSSNAFQHKLIVISEILSKSTNRTYPCPAYEWASQSTHEIWLKPLAITIHQDHPKHSEDLWLKFSSLFVFISRAGLPLDTRESDKWYMILERHPTAKLFSFHLHKFSSETNQIVMLLPSQSIFESMESEFETWERRG